MEIIVAKQKIIHIESLILDKLVHNSPSEQHLKCALRIIFLFSQKPSDDVCLTTNDLLNDPVILSTIQDNDPSRKLEEILRFAEETNILAMYPTKTSNKSFSLSPAISFGLTQELTRDSSLENSTRETIFAIYEKNISPLTPIIAEELKKAKSEYPEQMIKQAIIESAKNNARSWRYISRILERWQGEGQKDGRTQRYPARTKRY